jgi:hypothetical protein
MAALGGFFLTASALFLLGIVGGVGAVVDPVNPLRLVGVLGIDLQERLRTAAFIAIPLAFGVSLTATSVQTYINRRVPVAFQGRTFAIQNWLKNGSAIIPLLLVGAAATQFGVDNVLLATPLILLAVAYTLIFMSIRMAGLAPPRVFKCSNRSGRARGARRSRRTNSFEQTLRLRGRCSQRRLVLSWGAVQTRRLRSRTGGGVMTKGGHRRVRNGGTYGGAYLARDGCDVEVFEQADHIGGVTWTMRKEGFGWDLGPLMVESFAPGEAAGKVLAELGCADRVNFLRGFRGISFPDYQVFRQAEYLGPYWRREKLKELFPHEADGLDRYYRFYDTMMDLMSLAEQTEDAGVLRVLPIKLRMALLFNRVRQYQTWNAKQLMDHFFTDDKLKAFFTSILADLTVLPSSSWHWVSAFNRVGVDDRLPAQVSSVGPAIPTRTSKAVTASRGQRHP